MPASKKMQPIYKKVRKKFAAQQQKVYICEAFQQKVNTL